MQDKDRIVHRDSKTEIRCGKVPACSSRSWIIAYFVPDPLSQMGRNDSKKLTQHQAECLSRQWSRIMTQ